MKKFFKIMGIIFLVLIFIFLIFFIRNYIIIKNIVNKEIEIQNYTNCSYIEELYNNDCQNSKVVIEHKYKDGITNTIRNCYKNNTTNNIWINANTSEVIISSISSKKACIINNSNNCCKKKTTHSFPILFIAKDHSFSNTLVYALSHLIISDTINNQKCYKIISMYKNTAWISKENFTYLQTINNKDTIKYSNWKVNSLSNNDVIKPDLTGCEITTK